METLRKLTKKEENLIDLLMQKENLTIYSDWKNNTLAKEMNDGKMGSLKLCPKGI